MLIKLSIVLAALSFIYQKIAHNNTLHFSDFYEILSENKAFSFKTLIFLLILSCINWYFEIYKWKLLVKPLKKITFKQAFEQSLGSLTAALITPNRIGEYGAKAMYYEASSRKGILALNFISNFSQLMITTCIGLVGLLTFIKSYDTPFNRYYFAIYGSFMVLISILICLFLFKGRLRFKTIFKKKWLQFISHLSKKTLYTVLSLSFLRYAVFSFQFYYLLHIFQIDLTYLEALSIIATMYFLASIIPSVMLFDGFIKGSISVYLFSFVGAHELIILSIALMMWMLNFMIPSLIGCYYIFNFSHKTS